MITTTRSLARKSRGFTLAEMMVGATISGFVLTAILTAFLLLGRSGANIANYADMEAQARHGLELFAEDTRQASDLTWNSATEVSLVVNSIPVVYGFDQTNRVFYRTVNGQRRNLLSGVSAFEFKGYMITGADVDLSNLSTVELRNAASRVTKQLQLSLHASRTSQTVSTATNTVLSARYILRNKQVTT